MVANLNETRRIQAEENPGYLPDRKSVAQGAAAQHSTPDLIAERKKRATEILARWASEDDE